MNEAKYLFAGTTSADFLVVDHKNKCLHATISLGSLGITQIIALAPEAILVGCGNGILGKYILDAKGWQPAAQLAIKSKISSLSVSKGEILVVTNKTQALMVDSRNMQPALLQEAHNAKVSFTRFKDGDNSLFGVASDDGSFRLWDLQSRTVKGNPRSYSPCRTWWSNRASLLSNQR